MLQIHETADIFIAVSINKIVFPSYQTVISFVKTFRAVMIIVIKLSNCNNISNRKLQSF